jgi:hypothetical protein
VRGFKIEQFGSDVIGLRITGDPRRCEPESIRVVLPGAIVDVTRATDGPDADYWVHLYVHHSLNKSYCPETDGEVTARICDARLDQLDKHASESKLGDFNRPQLYHVALRVKRDSTNPSPPRRVRGGRRAESGATP